MQRTYHLSCEQVDYKFHFNIEYLILPKKSQISKVAPYVGIVQLTCLFISHIKWEIDLPLWYAYIFEANLSVNIASKTSLIPVATTLLSKVSSKTVLYFIVIFVSILYAIQT